VSIEAEHRVADDVLRVTVAWRARWIWGCILGGKVAGGDTNHAVEERAVGSGGPQWVDDWHPSTFIHVPCRGIPTNPATTCQLASQGHPEGCEYLNDR